jgi:hypothetical protein
MSLDIPKSSCSSTLHSSTAPKKVKKCGHTRPRRPEISLEETGRLRVANLLAILNISHATLYAGLKTGRYPDADGRDGSFPYWMTSTIKAFLEA